MRQFADAPPIDYAAGRIDGMQPRDTDPAGDHQPVSPAEAAAQAARAAVGEETGSDELTSGMDELAGMVAARRAASAKAEMDVPPVDHDVPA
jgi:hypothetical protein